MHTYHIEETHAYMVVIDRRKCGDQTEFDFSLHTVYATASIEMTCHILEVWRLEVRIALRADN